MACVVVRRASTIALRESMKFETMDSWALTNY